MLNDWLSPTSPLLQSPVLLALAIILCTFILEDPTTLAVGLLLEKHLVDFPFAFLSLAVGIFLGDLGLYFLGVAIRKGLWKTANKTIKLKSFTLVAMARFVPGMRTITFTSAGISEFPLKTFFWLALPSTIVWTLALLLVGKSFFSWVENYPRWVMWAILISIILFLQVLERVIRRRFVRSYEEKAI